jgi:phosphatidylglycerophosphatase A
LPPLTISATESIKLRTIVTSPSALIATVFGFGLFPIAPGTVGSGLALPIVWALAPFHVLTRVLIYTLSFPILVLAAQRAGSLFGEHDHRSIICDETWAMAVAWECTPAGYRWMVASFLAFRAFDIIKPWPISAADRQIKNGFGVMFDDAIAALFAIALIAAVDALMRLLG